MRPKFALCSEVFQSPIEETIDRIAALGFDGVEIAPFTIAESVEEISSERRRTIRERAKDRGIEIVGLHWLLVSPKGLHLTTADSDVRGNTARYISALADFCADVGGKVMILGSPKQRDLLAGTSPREAFDRAVGVLREAARTCEARGVKLLVEALHPRETTFLQSIEEAIALSEAVDSPSVGYMLDCKAMSGMPAGIEGTIAKHGANAGHFHANEPDGRGPGMSGAIDFRPILHALAESGFDGWISTEPFDYRPDPEAVARTALETLRRAAPIS